jgi:hypothetical protein
MISSLSARTNNSPRAREDPGVSPLVAGASAPAWLDVIREVTEDEGWTGGGPGTLITQDQALDPGRRLPADWPPGFWLEQLRKPGEECGRRKPSVSLVGLAKSKQSPDESCAGFGALVETLR